MKSMQKRSNKQPILVAPLAGAWIEIKVKVADTLMDGVAPLAGAWIEIHNRGKQRRRVAVAPLAGAWIEIPIRKKDLKL